MKTPRRVMYRGADLEAAYSGLAVTEDRPVRRVLPCAGRLWVVTGTASQRLRCLEASVHEVVPLRPGDRRPVSYAERSRRTRGRMSYAGIGVSCQGRLYRFTAREEDWIPCDAPARRKP